jgi:predicted SAM-dependent methyltransferase
MRLHLGASITQLTDPRLARLINRDWVHLVEPEQWTDQASSSEARPTSRDGEALHSRTLLHPFYYTKGQRLPFDDCTFSFAFSEHFFEHLFLDEAAELFLECHRVLKSRSCLRTVVPDADLRTYIPPEPAGFTVGDHRWYHPDKHKTRWSIYSLSYILQQTGFRTRGIVYCDKFGEYHCVDPAEVDAGQECDDRAFVDATEYILRFENSLIVDAIKIA